MKKFIFILILSLYSLTTLAQRDSVAFFYTPKKVNVLINERGVDSRLHAFMDYFRVDTELLLTSVDQDIQLGCAREVDRVSCTFTFHPSTDVQIANRELLVQKDLRALEVETSGSFEMSFRSSMKDNIHLTIIDGVLRISASKK